MFAYCGNNPVMCVDPNGQSGIIYNFVIKVVNTIWRRLSMMSKIAKIRTQMEEEKESEPEVSMPPIMYVSQRPGKEGFIEEDWGGNDPRDGCAVACTSMALSSLGIYMTPEEIIKNNGGIVLMCWRKSGSYIKVASIDEALHNYRSNPQKYAPPIVNVKPTGASSMHFAVIIGGGNGVYTTYDPYHGINTIYNITGSNRIIQYYIR